jgi:hypothetical protein
MFLKYEKLPPSMTWTYVFKHLKIVICNLYSFEIIHKKSIKENLSIERSTSKINNLNFELDV